MQPGDRLPPQRAVAAQLGVDLTTVTRAYAAARAAGLVEGEVGRGTFVSARPGDDEAGVADLSMNLPPPPEGLSLGALMSETLGAILQRTDAPTLMAYHPGFGTLGQRRAGAAWLAPMLGETPPERMLVSPGAQAALAATFQALCRPGDAVVCEPLTYPGFKAIAAQLGLRAIPGEIDADGLVPEQLTAICRRTRVAALYVIPTLQNPTTRTMPAPRRAALARAAEDGGSVDRRGRPLQPPARRAAAGDRDLRAVPHRPRRDAGQDAEPRPAHRLRRLSGRRAGRPPGRGAARHRAHSRAADGRARHHLDPRGQGACPAAGRARPRRAPVAPSPPRCCRRRWGRAESLHVWLPLASAASAETLRRAAQQRGLALVTHEAFAVGDAAAAGCPHIARRARAAGRRSTSALASLAETCSDRARVSSRLVV